MFLLLIWTLFNYGLCYNFDVKHAIVYENPASFDKDNYFGYSVILYPGDDETPAWIQIGAPRGMDPSAEDIKSGTVFRCGIGEICYNLYVHNFVNQRTRFRDYGWLGNAMDIDYNFKKYVICAYRWLNVAPDEYATFKVKGQCYFASTDDEHFKILNPLEYSSIPFSSVGQAGFSAHMTKCKVEPEILLGVPGIDNWQGTALIYRHTRSNLNGSRSASTSGKDRQRNIVFKEFGDLHIVPPAIAPLNNLFFSFDLLGYSVSSGYFFNSEEVIYLAGAPRSSRYFGKVFAFKLSAHGAVEPITLLSAEEAQFGEYFGAAIATGDWNNDGFDDVVVGAPFYSARDYNEGRILVYLGSQERKFILPSLVAIYGKDSGGQFGFAITALGDIDLDGYCDVAVSGPYSDDGRGVVFVYRGSPSGLNSEPSQIIRANEIDDTLRGFGSTFSKAADIDENHYDDVAIGAYKSGHTVLLRSRSILTLRQSVTSSTNKLAYGDNNFTIEHCIWYTGSFLPNIAYVARSFTMDPTYHRAFLANHNAQDITLEQEQIYCDNITVFLKNSTVFLPIIIIADLLFEENNSEKNIVHVSKKMVNEDSFCAKCPVYNKGSEIHRRLEIPYAIGCGNDNLCQAKLKLGVHFEKIKNNTFIIGANSNILNLVVKIKNSGEKALKTELNIQLPQYVYFANEKGRDQNETFDIGNPLNENEEKEMIISLDMTDINSGRHSMSSLSFTINVTTLSMVLNIEETKRMVVLKIVREADIYLRGESEQQSYSYGNFSVDSVNFTQLYYVQKYGPSPILASKIFIQVPIALRLQNGDVADILKLLTSETTIRDEIGLHCETNITKVREMLNFDGLNIEYYTPPLESVTESRRKRELTFNNENITEDTNYLDIKSEESNFDNRTYYLNCNNTKVVCDYIVCHVGKLVDQQDFAMFRLKMLLNISLMKDTLLKEKKDTILLSTVGNVYIDEPVNFVQSDTRPDEAIVSTLLIGPQQKYSVPLWIIVLSVIGGLLLMLLLVILLFKFGFFRRKKKEELDAWKKHVLIPNLCSFIYQYWIRVEITLKYKATLDCLVSCTMCGCTQLLNWWETASRRAEHISNAILYIPRMHTVEPHFASVVVSTLPYHKHHNLGQLLHLPRGLAVTSVLNNNNNKSIRMSGTSACTYLVHPEIEAAMVADLEERYGFTSVRMDISPGSVKGDNYLGIIAKAVIEATDAKGERVTLHRIVKISSQNDEYRTFTHVDKIFGREAYMYVTVLPALAKFQREVGVVGERAFLSFARAHYTCLEPYREAIVMDDMKHAGYVMRNRRVPLDLKHSTKVMQEYGRFHAISFAMRDQKPQTFQYLADNLHESWFHDLRRVPFEKLLHGHNELAKASLGRDDDPRAKRLHLDYVANCYDRLMATLRPDAAGEFSVIGHGDSWVNNILFKYDEIIRSQPASPTAAEPLEDNSLIFAEVCLK